MKSTKITSVAAYEAAITRIAELQSFAPDSPEAHELLTLVRAVEGYDEALHEPAREKALGTELKRLLNTIEAMRRIGDGVVSAGIAKVKVERTYTAGYMLAVLGLLAKVLSVARGVERLCRDGLHMEALGLHRSLLDATVNLKLLTEGDVAANENAVTRFHHACNREVSKVFSQGRKLKERSAIIQQLGRPNDRVAAVLAAKDLGPDAQQELWSARHWSVGAGKADDGSVYERVGMGPVYGFEYRLASASVHAKDYDKYLAFRPERWIHRPGTTFFGVLATSSSIRQLVVAIEIVGEKFAIPVPGALRELLAQAIEARTPQPQPGPRTSRNKNRRRRRSNRWRSDG